MKRALVVGLLACAACDKKPEGASQAKLPQVSAALTSAGFKTEGFKDLDPARFSAQKCTEGQLEGLDAVLCEYGSAEAVALGKKAGDGWLGEAPTGVVIENGLTLLALADRARADPNGKTIHRITQAYVKAR